MLVDSHQSGLPAFLAKEGGLNSGFMSAQISATALASENRSLAHPTVIDNIPTGANQEDDVSMATFAAHRLGQINSNLAYILFSMADLIHTQDWAGCENNDTYSQIISKSRAERVE